MMNSATGVFGKTPNFGRNPNFGHPFSASIQHIEGLLGILDVLFTECEKVLALRIA